MTAGKLFLSLLSLLFFLCARSQEVLLRAHAHNDYKHCRPLTDAIEQGFFSVEADVFYEKGAFIVAHTKAGIRRTNTLERLYLQPLEKLAAAHHGKIYASGPPEFELMIDLKNGWDLPKLDSLSRLVKKYEEMLTVFRNGEKTTGAVKIILSGSGIKYEAAKMNPRYFSIDGSPADSASELDSTIICRVSASYNSSFQWKGRGRMPEDERKNLQALADQSHASGRKIRFWATPDRERLWQELLSAGVDWINVDRLKKFRRFYAKYRSR